MRLGPIALFCCINLAAITLGPTVAEAQLIGHGGPVRALAVSADGATALSGSFDTAAIRWSLRDNAAEQVLRFHEGAVNAVAILGDGREATAGADARIAIWTPGREKPDTVLEGHAAPVVALAVSPDSTLLASASWDRTVRLWPLAGGAPRVLEGHRQNVNGVAFALDGKALVSAGYDATLRIWPLQGGGTPVVVPMPTPLNAVIVAGDGEIAAAGADGKVYFLSPGGERRDVVEASPAPLTSLAASADGGLVAAASIDGRIAIIDRRRHTLARTLMGPALPVWSVAFLPDGHTLLGGGDRAVRRWDVDTGAALDGAAGDGPKDTLAAYGGDPGAKVFRACVACHTLNADEGERAGPTLHRIFGRRIASLPGYRFSEPLKHLDIVWTPETISKLFEIGPAAFTPGTKMPEQRIGAAEDREALVKFLERATR